MDVTTLAMAKAYTDKNMDSLFEGSVREITWNGDTTGHDAAEDAYYISSLIPKMENLVGGSITITENGESTVVPFESCASFGVENGILAYNFMVCIVFRLKEPNESGITCPKEGIWLRKRNDTGAYVSKLTFGIPLGEHVVKTDLIPSAPVFDLDSCGLNLTQAILAGGGTFEVNASHIFDSIERGKNYLFSTTLILDDGAQSKLEFPPAFYQYNEAGELFRIGLSFAGTAYGKAILGNGLMTRRSMYLVFTPLGM